MKFPFFSKKAAQPSASLSASATVSTPAIPLPSNNPEWRSLARVNSKDELAQFDARLERMGYARDGQLRTAVKQKYEAL